MHGRRQTRRGGKRIGNGTVNVVFSVPFPCDPPLDDRPVVMLISLNALKGVQDGASPYRLRVDEVAKPSRPSKEALETLRKIDPNAERFYYPLNCSIRAPEENEDADTDLLAIVPREKLSLLVPYVQIVPYGQAGTPQKLTDAIRKRVEADVVFLHEHGIAHGDISTNNIVLDTNGIPHLIDFGQSSVRIRDTDKVQTAPGFEDDIPTWSDAVRLDNSDIRRVFRSTQGASRRRKTLRRHRH